MRLLTILIAFTCFAGCRATRQISVVKTDLLDNESVAQTYRDYIESNRHCRTSQSGKRAIVTGFGLFGSPHNISGIVAMSLVKPSFFPEEIDFDEEMQPPSGDVWGHGEDHTRNGGLVRQRTLTIDGELYDVCAIYLDVQWDLAAAIILYEARLFQPDLIIMSGMNGAEPTRTLFESGAINKATAYAGFGPSGIQTLDNVPIEENTPVLPDMPLGETVALSWDAAGLVAANGDLINAISSDHLYSVDVGYVRESNDYICNNVSLVVSEGLRGRTVQLAGGQIVVPGVNTATKVGFLHYPSQSSEPSYADSGQEIFGWTKVLANSIKHGI